MSEAQVQAALLADLAGRGGKVETAAIHTGQVQTEAENEVTAELILPAGTFKTDAAQLAQTQTARPDATLRWQWFVEPLKAGSFPVQIKVTAKVRNERSGVSTPYSDTVQVDAGPAQSAAEWVDGATEWLKRIDGLLTLFGTSIAAAGGYLWKRKRGRKA